ncbi:MAG: ABC transporter ATP-binding protein [Cytophagales bacterium]|nr:ABC transporter ATP-binding protein [Bernardetiaceae bacterium]MDW8209588.1 ABC transporter ATP-binding protein [Cytophagales bacterium]
MMLPLLQTHQLSIGYRAKPIMQALELSLFPATVTALLGRNGSGKSTLIKTLAGLHPPLSGSIFITGEAIHSRTSIHWLAQRVSVMLPEPIYAPFMTGYELVALGRTPYTSWTGRLTKHDRQLIAQALEITCATELQHARLEELSDGQRQKLSLARAIAQNTPLLLLDEPLSHLDLANSAILINNLRTYAHSYQKAIVMSLHHIEIALHMADITWVIDQHHHLHVGLPEQLALEGVIHRIFAGSHVHFDLASGHFSFALTGNLIPLPVETNLSSMHLQWLARALAKRHLSLQPTQGASWRISQASQTHFCWQHNQQTGIADMKEMVQMLVRFAEIALKKDFSLTCKPKL